MSGEFLQVNAALVRELKAHGLWTPDTREAVKRADGSVQGITAPPPDIRKLFRRPEDDLLPAVPACYPHPAGHRQRAGTSRRRCGHGVLPGKPRDVRGLPVTAADTTRAPAKQLLLDPGMDLTLRPMRYPHFYDRFREAIKNTWTVEEVDLHSDLGDLACLSPAEQHLISRLVAFFATGDTIVANNLVLNLYQHVNSPEGCA
jgi:Ribonucleotide reductase, small chain